MYDRVLVPLDGSPLAEAALAVAGRIPSRLTYLLRVDQEPPEVEHRIGPGGRDTHTRVRYRDGDEDLRRAGAALGSRGREVEVLRSWGDPADRIVETAADVDLIVMATHGRGAAGRLLYGSVADRVAREASVPVLLVPSGAGRPLPAPDRILVPLDGSDLAETAMPAAVALAAELDLPIHLVCVVDASHGDRLGAIKALAPDARPSTLADHAARVYLTDCARRYGDERPVTTEVRSGATIAGLRAAIRPADLVVMTTHGHRGLRRLVLGSVAGALVRRAIAPVLLLRAGAGIADIRHSSMPEASRRQG